MILRVKKTTIKSSLLAILFFILIGFLFGKLQGLSGLIPLPSSTGQSINLLTIFLTGLVAGGLTCMAVQGGLLAATLAQGEEEKLKANLKSSGNAIPILSFLGAKLVAYTALGLLLGLFGSFFKLSISTQVILQIAVGVFMLGTALNILNVHPIFRYFVIQPPRFLTRMVRKQSKSNDVFAPALLGAFTVLIPCGTTQAMMALSIASGSPMLGAAILFAFVLGTSPIFFILGYFTTKLQGTLHENFMRFAALGIILLAFFNINNALSLSGSTITFSSLGKSATCLIGLCNASAQKISQSAPVNDAAITIEASGYNPNNLTVKAGEPITLRLTNKGGQGCTQAFTIPSMGIQKIIPLGGSDTIAFTAPSQPGTIPFMCSMGMFRGEIQVI